VSTIAAQVYGDSIRSGLLACHRCRDHTWLRRTPRLAHGCDVIDVDVETSCHGGNYYRSNKSYKTYVLLTS
jgi:hypothetical protein